MEHYVTLFDSAFLPQGVALHRSMQAHAGPYTLWVLCMDDTAHDVLTRLALPNARLLKLADVETPELARARASRTRVEYCWTLTPFTPKFVLDAEPAARRVTYVDADLWLMRNPAPVFEELEASGKQVLITEHAFAPENDKSAENGRFCVQFMTFARGAGAERVRAWWAERCLEHVSEQSGDGRFGDQKYLDDWPERFASEVHVLRHMEWTLAPWNATRFPHLFGVMYHFHGLRLLADWRVNLGEYPLPPTVVTHVYEPYLRQFSEAIDTLRRAGFEPKPQQAEMSAWLKLRRSVGGLVSRRRRLRNRNIRPL